MKMLHRMRVSALALGIGWALAQCAAAQEPAVGQPLKVLPAVHWKTPDKLVLLDVARAGKRLVAVGEMGVIVLSDDDGKTFRQARTVPADGMLNAVTFVDAQHGWAVGHLGLILATSDGGETWVRQRVDTSVDQPLFSVAFRDASEGWAVGLWSLVLHTTDAGRNWTAVKINPPPGASKADKNLYHVFLDKGNGLFVAAEQGYVLHSTDGGQSWTYLSTGYAGSFWTGMVTQDGTVLVGGLRGNLYRSTDDGTSWSAVPTGTQLSITRLAEANGNVLGVGLDGLVVQGKPHDAKFSARQVGDRTTLTSMALAGNGQWVFSAKSGIVTLSKDNGM
ncbi:MAG: glycosyl hydrolase [Burkholderiaceae bacterium]|nr:glycosyl hydrolase [Burkholderiaceae bacterium]